MSARPRAHTRTKREQHLQLGERAGRHHDIVRKQLPVAQGRDVYTRRRVQEIHSRLLLVNVNVSIEEEEKKRRREEVKEKDEEEEEFSLLHSTPLLLLLLQPQQFHPLAR